MRRSISVLALLLATTACGQIANDNAPPGASGGDNAVSEVAFDAAPDQASASRGKGTEAGPDIDPNNAPGVAFAYRYAFSLDGPRVAEVQQEHQRLCESYGVARCRITGMTYRATSEENVEATLSFSVDPAIASRFTRDSVSAVTAADGRLADSNIDGTDVGTSIDANTRDINALQAQLNRLEARIAAGGISREERARLQGEAESLRQRINERGETRAGQERSLATTPIVYRYGAGTFAPRPEGPLTVDSAWQRSLDNLGAVGLGAMIVAITLAPWILIGLLLWWAATRIRRRWFRKPEPEATA